MKKILALLFMFVALTGLVSCNDDGTENDAPYTARLVGSWQMSNSNDELTIQSDYRFDSHSSFVYSYSSMNLKDITMRTWSIRGAWNVKKGVLQLSYDWRHSVRTAIRQRRSRRWRPVSETITCSCPR